MKGTGRSLVLLPLLTASGMLPGTMLAVIVTVARGGLGFSTAQAATLAASDIYGAALGALLTALIGVPVAWRRAAAIALGAMIAMDLLSVLLDGFAPLIAARGARGVIGGVVMGIGYAAIGRTASPDRGFGLLLVVQFVIGGLGIALLPSAVLATGPWLLFAVFAAATAVMLALLPLLPALPRRSEAGSKSAGFSGLLLASLAALLLFQAAHTAGGAYVLEIGRMAGFGLGFVQLGVGLAGIGGAVGALLVALVDRRFGRIGPILLATAIGIVGNVLLLSHVPALFVTGAALGALTWGASIPFVLSLCATMDRDGRGAAWASFAAKLGLASGPVLGALVVGEGSFLPAVALACVFAALAAALLVIAPRFGGSAGGF